MTAVSPEALASRLDELAARRAEASERFFAAEAERIARLCGRMGERFAAGGRLLAVGGSPQAWSDAHHVAVEFVHPVIVGKRALPALAVPPEGVELLAGPEDMVVRFEPFALSFAGSPQEWGFRPPTADPFVAQELVETLYHVLWERVHVFLEHRGRASAGAGASTFLYPFLGGAGEDVEAVVADVRASVLAKAGEAARLRTELLAESREPLAAAAAAVRRSLAAGGRILAFGNGGSATDATDAVADLRAAPQGWPAREALNLASDPAVLTALANDVGPEVQFARQVIAYGREGDVALAFSTSGDSASIVAALAEARRRGLVTIAFLGYDGGRVAAERLADHLVVSRSQHIPRIQEAHASGYHALRELVEVPG